METYYLRFGKCVYTHTFLIIEIMLRFRKKFAIALHIHLPSFRIMAESQSLSGHLMALLCLVSVLFLWNISQKWENSLLQSKSYKLSLLFVSSCVSLCRSWTCANSLFCLIWEYIISLPVPTPFQGLLPQIQKEGKLQIEVSRQSLWDSSFSLLC